MSRSYFSFGGRHSIQHHHLRRLIPFIIIGTVLQVAIFTAISFVPLFVVDEFNVSEEIAAALFSLIHFTGLWAGPIGGYLSDRLGKVPVMLVVSFLAGPAIYLLSLVSFGWSISLVLLLIGICMYISMPVAEAYVISHTSERNRSTILGIYYFSAIEGGGIVTPVVGYLIDQFGFYLSFTIAAASVVAVTLACALFLWGSPE